MSDAAPEVPQEAEPHTPPGGSRSGLTGKLKLVALLLVIVLVECAAAAFFIPSAAETTALAEARRAAQGEESILPDAAPLTPPDEPEVAKVEVSLGEFGVTSYQPLSNTTLRIDFQLYATVPAADESKFTQLMEGNQHRFREQVLVILRSAEMTDLTDAGLGLIKRKILEKTNRLLGEALVQEVIFSDFSFIEQ